MGACNMCARSTLYIGDNKKKLNTRKRRRIWFLCFVFEIVCLSDEQADEVGDALMRIAFNCITLVRSGEAKLNEATGMNDGIENVFFSYVREKVFCQLVYA